MRTRPIFARTQEDETRTNTEQTNATSSALCFCNAAMVRNSVTQQPKAQQRQLVERGDAVPVAACGERSVEREVAHYVDDTSGVALCRRYIRRRPTWEGLPRVKAGSDVKKGRISCSFSATTPLLPRFRHHGMLYFFESARLNPTACTGDATSGLNVWAHCFHDE
jgi:hypothetical protein